jgi:hypothetical protein
MKGTADVSAVALAKEDYADSTDFFKPQKRKPKGNMRYPRNLRFLLCLDFHDDPDFD